MPSPRDPLSGGRRPPAGAGSQRTYYSSRPSARKPKKDTRSRNGIIIVVAILACVFGVGWNPPHDTVHAFSSASDYKVASDSGCTNSGAGCHGSESSYRDFNAYHPHATCSTCHAYQGIACIPCHAPNTNHECQLCHDGSMKLAPDVVGLRDNYPNGHYRETTHTAMADNYDQPVTAQPDGKAKATCADCHSRDLGAAHTNVTPVPGSPYSPSLACGQCHNDVRAFGQAEVIANWKSRKCEACHKVGSSAPMHSTSTAPSVTASDSPSCASTGEGCHDTADLHLIHADKPANCSGSAKKGEPGCHKQGTEALKPTAKTCGGEGADSCHKAGPKGTYAHKREVYAHSPSNNRQSSAVFDGVTCGECHLMAPNGHSLLDEHDRATSAHTTMPSDTCRNCHSSPASSQALEDGWAGKSTLR